MMNKKFWSGVMGAMLLWLGGTFLWQGRSGLLYHTPIYFKGPSWVNPWSALVAGGVFILLGVLALVNGLRGR